MALALMPPLALLATGCSPGRGDAAGHYVRDPGSGEISAGVETDGARVTLRSGRTVAPDLPLGFTVYPGARVLSVTSGRRETASGGDAEDGARVGVTMASADDPAAIAAFYRLQARDADIAIDLDVPIGARDGGEAGSGRSLSGRGAPDRGKGRGPGQGMGGMMGQGKARRSFSLRAVRSPRATTGDKGVRTIAHLQVTTGLTR